MTPLCKLSRDVQIGIGMGKSMGQSMKRNLKGLKQQLGLLTIFLLHVVLLFLSSGPLALFNRPLALSSLSANPLALSVQLCSFGVNNIPV